MPVAPTYPGVYVEEIPSGVHPIAGVPTAIAAFIGRFPKGRMNQAVEVLSFADVEREFGGLTRDSDTSFALSQYFLNGGGRGWVVRVAGAGTGSTALKKAAVTVPAAGSGDAFAVRARSEGAWGNGLRVQIIGPDNNEFDMLVTLVATEGGRTTVVQQERYRGLVVDPDSANYVLTAVNGISHLVEVSAATPKLPKATGLVSGGGLSTLAADKAGTIEVTLTIGADTVVAKAVIPGPLANLEDIAASLQSAIRTTRGADPVWAQATVHPLVGAKKVQIVTGVGNEATITIDNDGTPTTATALKLKGGGSASTAGSLVLVGGGDGEAPGAAEIVGSEASGTGMYALDNTDFTLLCLPSIGNQQTSDLDAFQTAGYATVVSNAITYCRNKRALLLLDPPTTRRAPTALRSWLNTAPVRDEVAAMYFPRLAIPDPTRNYQLRSVGPAGTIAGLMARVDSARGVWKSPAGTDATLRGVDRLEWELTDAENGVLNPIAVNCLRRFPAYGTVAWGARTLAGSDAATSEYRYVAIRRFANFLESSLKIGLQWVVFEPNDEPLWSQIRMNVGSFLHGLFRQGAFAGRTPRDAYLVQCDASTTTPTDQALGVVNVLVGFAPLRPAEFVVLRIQQLAGQTES